MVTTMTNRQVPNITIFHCINSFNNGDRPDIFKSTQCAVKTVKLACSSMVKDVFLLKAFEAGADAVIVLVCPEGTCRHSEGNIRAAKRVAWVKGLLDEIGLDGRRLSLHNVSPGDNDAIERILTAVRSELADLGPNPAA